MEVETGAKLKLPLAAAAYLTPGEEIETKEGILFSNEQFVCLT